MKNLKDLIEYLNSGKTMEELTCTNMERINNDVYEDEDFEEFLHKLNINIIENIENQLFGDIAGMNLWGGLEQIYAEATRAIGAASDSISSQPMIQSNNPLRAELSTIFDSLS